MLPRNHFPCACRIPDRASDATDLAGRTRCISGSVRAFTEPSRPFQTRVACCYQRRRIFQTALPPGAKRSALGNEQRGADAAPQTRRFGGNRLRASLGIASRRRAHQGKHRSPQRLSQVSPRLDYLAKLIPDAGCALGCAVFYKCLMFSRGPAGSNPASRTIPHFRTLPDTR